MVSIYVLFGWLLALWAVVLIVADLFAAAAPVKRTTTIFWLALAIWIVFSFIAFPLHR